MATKTWIGNAHDVKQIYTITVGGTWAAGDTATMTINGKDLVITGGSTTTTTATVAAALKEAWMSATRLDGSSSSSNATSNFGGQEFGEFAEETASVSGSVVTIIGNKAGKPFTVTLSETAASGTLTAATPQAATGKNHWDNADNWDSGTVPANDDVVVFRDSNVSCLYGLPNGSLKVTVEQWMSYTGEVGLPAINVDDALKPYYEYRQRYVRLDNSGTGTNMAHRFGLGKDGAGCRLFNLKHSTVKCSPIVYNTGTPLVTRVGTKALNICLATTTNDSTLNVLNGSVDCSSQDSGTATILTLTQAGGDIRSVGGVVAASTVKSSGGTMLLGGTPAITTITADGGRITMEGQSGTVTTIHILDKGIVENSSSSMTISNANVFAGGTFDLRGNAGAYTLTNATIHKGGKFLDPYRRTTMTNAVKLSFDPTPDLLFGATTVNTVSVSNT